MDYFVPQGLATNEKGEDFREAAGSAYDSWTYDVEAAKELWKSRSWRAQRFLILYFNVRRY